MVPSSEVASVPASSADVLPLPVNSIPSPAPSTTSQATVSKQLPTTSHKRKASKSVEPSGKAAIEQESMYLDELVDDWYLKEDEIDPDRSIGLIGKWQRSRAALPY